MAWAAPFEHHPVRFTGAGPKLGYDNVIIWSDQEAADALSTIPWLERISPFAANPDTSLSDRDQKRLDAIITDITNGSFPDTEFHFNWHALTLVLSRWGPGTLGQMIRRTFSELPIREAKSLDDPAARMEEANFVLKDEQRESLLIHALEKLKNLTSDPDDKERREERRLKNMAQ